jgi:hypothetical protein
MKFRGLLIALVLLAALGGLLYWSQRHPQQASKPDTNALPAIVTIPAGNILSFTLTEKGNPPITVEAHGKDQWQITAPIQGPADHAAVEGILDGLNRLVPNESVADHAANLAEFGLDQPALAVDVTETGNRSARLQFGDKTPTGDNTYVMVGGNLRVYTVPTYTFQSFNKPLDQLRDKRLLPLKADDVSEVELARPNETIELDRKPAGWQIQKPEPYRADSNAADSLVRDLVNAKFDGAVATSDAESGWSKASPMVKVTLTATTGGNSATDTLEVRKGAKGDFYAKASALPGTWKLDSSVDSALAKNLDDLRNKQLLDLGFSEPLNIDYHSQSTSLHLVRSGQDWFQNGKKMDFDSVEALVSALRSLSASGFATSGFTQSDIDLTVTSQDGKTVDKVHFQQTKDGAIAKRDDGPALYTLDAATMNALYSAASGVKAAAAPSPTKK